MRMGAKLGLLALLVALCAAPLLAGESAEDAGDRDSGGLRPLEKRIRRRLCSSFLMRGVNLDCRNSQFLRDVQMDTQTGVHRRETSDLPWLHEFDLPGSWGDSAAT